MHYKKILCFVLLAVLLCCMLCACGEKTEQERKTLSLPTSTEADAAQPSAQATLAASETEDEIDLSDNSTPRTIEIKPAETAAVKIG